MKKKMYKVEPQQQLAASMMIKKAVPHCLLQSHFQIPPPIPPFLRHRLPPPD